MSSEIGRCYTMWVLRGARKTEVGSARVHKHQCDMKRQIMTCTINDTCGKRELGADAVMRR
jgi:hypothetical protein